MTIYLYWSHVKGLNFNESNENLPNYTHHWGNVRKYKKKVNSKIFFFFSLLILSIFLSEKLFFILNVWIFLKFFIQHEKDLNGFVYFLEDWRDRNVFCNLYSVNHIDMYSWWVCIFIVFFLLFFFESLEQFLNHPILSSKFSKYLSNISLNFAHAKLKEIPKKISEGSLSPNQLHHIKNRHRIKQIRYLCSK